MAIKKEQKVEMLGRVTDLVKKAQSAVFVNFHGLSVSETTSLRSGLRSEGVSYLVAKKTLVKRALADAGVKGEQPALDGELAIAYGEDLTAPARGIYEFQKTHKKNISILGGVFEGEFMNQEQMTGIATIPPTPVLRGMFVNVINSPIQGLVIALNQIAEKKTA